MVHPLQSSSSSSSLHILLIFLFSTLLILTCSMEVAFSDARRLPLRLLPEGTGSSSKAVAMATTANKQEAAAGRSSRGEMEGRRRALIGSRPPRCERLCMSCGHCEAVQVPIVPQQASAATSAAAAATLTAAMFTYRVDGIANYKPLSWKCRCGGTILDP